MVTAIKTDPAPQVVHYQPPSYKPESPFNGQSYIIEPSYVLKPFRPETSYHAQAYRPHNPAPAIYQPAYHAPGYSAYQPPSYPAPVYQPPAYQPQAYPSPAYQNPAQSSVFLVYSTPLLAGYSTQTASNSGPVTNIQPSATQVYVATASAAIKSVSSNPVQQFTIVESTASVPVEWSDILSSDANELGQKYIAENGAEELRSTTQESIPKSHNSELPRKTEQVEHYSSEKSNPPLYPIPANHTSKAVWKIPKTTGSYGSVPDSSTESVKNVGDKSDERNQANKKSTIDSNEAETEESSKSNLAGKANIVGTQNKESSEITSVDQVTEISLQGKLTKYEGRTTQAVALSTSRGTSEDKSEAAVVELVGQVSPQHEKLRSGSSVYYEQGPRVADNAEQHVNEAKRNGESKESDRDQAVAEMSEREKEQNGEINSEEDGTEATPVINTNEANEQVSALLKSFYYTGANAKKPEASIQVKETGQQKEVSQYGQSVHAQGLVLRQDDEVDADSNETTEVSISKADVVAYQPMLHPQDPAVETELIKSVPNAAPVDEHESDEVPNAVNPAVTIQPTVSSYQIPHHPPRPIVPQLFRAKQESEEVEPPTAGFGEKIKVFTKFATAIQKVNQQDINEADHVTGKDEISSNSSVSNTNVQPISNRNQTS